MSKPEQTIFNHSDVNERKPLTIRLSYVPELIPQIPAAIDYILSKLNFLPAEKINITEQLNSGPIYLRDQDGNSLIFEINELKNKQEIKYLIVHTTDCIRDYHKYTIAGVEFINRPEYTEAGLQVDFIDNRDNRYTLLEERIYTDY